MNRRFAIHTLGALVALCSIASANLAWGASWDAFASAQFGGIALDKPLQVNVLDYTLALGDNPTITLGSHTYPVNWVQSFYVVSGEPNGTFTATNGVGNTGWSWDSKTSGGGQISGWTGQGSNRIDPGESKVFHFSSFDPHRNPVVTGFHVSYQDGQDTVTGWWKDRSLLTTVPEPSTMAALAVPLVGLYAFARRRRTRLTPDS